MISEKDLLTYVEKDFVITSEMHQNMSTLIASVNNLLADWGKRVVVTSGLRSPAKNMAVGGSTNSNHLKGLAVDFSDFHGDFGLWCEKNLGLLEKYSLWMEDRRYCPHWLHLQCVPPKSGNRIFIPR